MTFGVSTPNNPATDGSKTEGPGSEGPGTDGSRTESLGLRTNDCKTDRLKTDGATTDGSAPDVSCDSCGVISTSLRGIGTNADSREKRQNTISNYCRAEFLFSLSSIA